MNTNIDTFSVTDLRHKTSQILENLPEKGVVYIIRHAKKQAALVDIKYLTALQEAYEDYIDTIEYDKTIHQKRIPLSEHKGIRSKTE